MVALCVLPPVRRVTASLCSGAGAAAAREGDTSGRVGGGGVRGGRGSRAACRAPVLLSDMILLMAIGNGFAALAGRIRSFLPGFPPSSPLLSAWMGTQTGRGATSRLGLYGFCFQAGLLQAQPWMAPEIPPQRTSRPAPVGSSPRAGGVRGTRPLPVPRGHGLCPKEVNLISPISQMGKLRPGEMW